MVIQSIKYRRADSRAYSHGLKNLIRGAVIVKGQRRICIGAEQVRCRFEVTYLIVSGGAQVVGEKQHAKERQADPGGQQGKRQQTSL